MERVKPELRDRINRKINFSLIQDAGSVTEFAKSIGVSRDTVNNWLSGKSDLRLNDLVNISKEYEVSVDWLLGTVDDANYSNDATIRLISEYTGLSTKAIEQLHLMNPDRRKGLMPLLEDEGLGGVGGFLKYAFLSISKTNPDNRSPWFVSDIPQTSFDDDGTIKMILSPKEAAKQFLKEAQEHMSSILESLVVKEWNKKGGK